MHSFQRKDPSPQMLHVYELRGEGSLPDPPVPDLAGIWPQAPYYYLFYRADSLGSLLDWLKSHPRWQLTSEYLLPYEKWQDISGEAFRVGPFSILPATDFEGTGPGVPIRIDPGVVFGSGVHPTTKGCLLAISELFAGNEVTTVVDFGTGTGILAIACALLGVGRAWAVDCVPSALAVARQNALANNAADRIGFVAADRLSVLNSPSDLLVTNLEWPVMEGLLHGDDWKGYGLVILSGFLEEVVDRVESMVRPWYRQIGKRVIEGWPTLSLGRR